jgi:hypothetical protein
LIDAFRRRVKAIGPRVAPWQLTFTVREYLERRVGLAHELRHDLHRDTPKAHRDPEGDKGVVPLRRPKWTVVPAPQMGGIVREVDFGENQNQISAVRRDARELTAEGAEEIAVGGATPEQLFESRALIALAGRQRRGLPEHLSAEGSGEREEAERKEGWPEGTHDG